MIETTYIRQISSDDNEFNEVLALLYNNNIRMDDAVEKTYVIYQDDRIMGTASILGNTIRSVAMAADAKGTNLLGELINDLMNDLYDEGYSNIFVYTKPENSKSFQHLGFYEIESIQNQVTLLERKPNGIQNFVNYLKAFKTNHEKIGSIVMNGNPFTLGHLYLVEYAARECDFLYIFVLNSENTTFSSDDRYRLIVAGTSHLENVYVIKGSDYIISNATFPTYFLKNQEEGTALQTELDLRIFGKYFVKILGISKRFVGNEPYCKTTNLYNEQMKRIMPEYGVEIVEIPRKEADLEAISASKVRFLLGKGKLNEVKRLVPKTTYDYFKTPQGKQVIEKLKYSVSRH